ncbi:hypothetical protein FPQ18DRAFT_396140 [Pyronema domesticum]|nr:hypothetical protein FPQ18DRAFT_396140 [Pyronema domesticum]
MPTPTTILLLSLTAISLAHPPYSPGSSFPSSPPSVIISPEPLLPEGIDIATAEPLPDPYDTSSSHSSDTGPLDTSYPETNSKPDYPSNDRANKEEPELHNDVQSVNAPHSVGGKSSEGSKSGGAASTAHLDAADSSIIADTNHLQSVNAPQYPPDVVNPDGVQSVNAPLYPPGPPSPPSPLSSSPPRPHHDPYDSDNSPDHSDHSDDERNAKDGKKKHLYPRGGGGGKKGGGGGVSGSGRVKIPVLALVGVVIVAAAGVGMVV